MRAPSVHPFFDSLAAVVFVWEFYVRLSFSVFITVSSTIIGGAVYAFCP